MKELEEVKKTYNRIAKRYHELLADRFFNAYIEVPATSSLLENVKNKKVLDLGCGTGIYIKILKRRKAKVWGIDLSPKMIEIAKSEIKDVNFKIGSVYKLPYESNFFDIVVAGLVIEHFKNLDKAFREVYRVLKKNGIFIFSFSHPVVNVSESIEGKPKIYRKFGDYFKEGKKYSRWPTFKVKMPYYHRTFQTLIRTIIRNKFIIEDYIDAKAIRQSKKLYPSLYKTYSKIPYFSVFKVRKVIK